MKSEYGSIVIRNLEYVENNNENNHAEDELSCRSTGPKESRSLYLKIPMAAIMFFCFTVWVLNPSDNNNEFSSNMTSLSMVTSASTSSSTGSDKKSSSKGDDPSEPHVYKHQLVNHHDPEQSDTFKQRYYAKSDYFGGPGSPIFFIFGGEDPLENLLYPFIYDHLAKKFNAYTFALEHRFFGESLPMKHPTNADLHELLTPNQALWDAVKFIQDKRQELGCSLDRSSSDYCPVITVGGSYPGFLSGLMRFAHSDVVDISYAASAPFNLYSHHVDQYAYYDKITETADSAVPGCANAVRTALYDAQNDIIGTKDKHLKDLANEYGMCKGSVPKYIDNTSLFSEELMMIIITHFANGNMDYYPPGPDQDFYKACEIFMDDDLETSADKIKAFLLMDDKKAKCFDMMTELPPGKYGTISASDWSGVGSGPEGLYWEFISCQLIPECGFSVASMFPPRAWTLDWVTNQCMRRFDWKPDIHALEDEFHFDDRSQVTHLLLTNGIVDGWSVASVTAEDPAAPGVKVVNMVNGAHHSDLSHTGPTENDTPDVREAFKEITQIIGDWLDEIREEETS